jgi:hypothetical protein
VTAKYTDSAEVLGGYSAVVLSDVRTILQDKEALKGAGAITKDKPDYFAVLEKSKAKFTTALHGNFYPPSEVVFAAELFALPGFTGAAITYAHAAPMASAHIWPEVNWVYSALPYQMLSEPDDDHPSPGHAAGITGRFIPNKGPTLLALAAATGHIHGDVELWGACSVGAGPSQSYRLYESLTKELGLPGERKGNEPETVSGGDIIRPHPWQVTGPKGVISYKGGYEDPMLACWRLAVHSDLTASTFSHGMEFSQFESIDAGCGQVSVESMWHPDFTGMVIPAIPVISGEKKLLNTDAGKELIATVGEAVMRAKAKMPMARQMESRYNRRMLATVNKPSVVAEKFLECL